MEPTWPCGSKEKFPPPRSTTTPWFAVGVPFKAKLNPSTSLAFPSSWAAVKDMGAPWLNEPRSTEPETVGACAVTETETDCEAALPKASATWTVKPSVPTNPPAGVKV